MNNKQGINNGGIIDSVVLKTLGHDQLQDVCDQIRERIINDVSQIGGHFSSNLGVVELTVALHRVFDPKKDKIIFDVGHQAYAHKLLTGRDLLSMGKRNGTSPFQCPEESNTDPYSAGHSSTSLSAAEAFALVRDRKGDDYNIVVVVGDSALANGLAFEAINDIGCRKSKIIVILNDNGRGITDAEGSLGHALRQSAGSPRALFEKFGYEYVGPVDGHDVMAVEKALRTVKNGPKPVLLHCFTVKGKGYDLAEGDKKGIWHGVEPFDVESGLPKTKSTRKWQTMMADLVSAEMENDDSIELIAASTRLGSKMDIPFSEHPDRCLDFGIAEEHAITFAGALALTGIKPIVSIYSTFLQRAYDQLSHDCARLDSNMTLLIDRAGLVGTNGKTHQGIYDVAYLNSIPGVTVSMPANESEAKQLLKFSLRGNGLFAIRYPVEPVKSSHKDVMPLVFGELLRISGDGAAKKAFVAVGPLGRKFLEACPEDADCYAAVFLNRFSKGTIENLIKHEEIALYDPYSTHEGFTSIIESALIEAGYKGTVKHLCIPNAFIPHGTVDEQLTDLGLTVEQAKKALF